MKPFAVQYYPDGPPYDEQITECDTEAAARAIYEAQDDLGIQAKLWRTREDAPWQLLDENV